MWEGKGVSSKVNTNIFVWVLFKLIVWKLTCICGKVVCGPNKKNKCIKQRHVQKHYYFWNVLHILLEERRDRDLFSYKICLVFLPTISANSWSQTLLEGNTNKWQNLFFEKSHPLPKSNHFWVSILRNPTHTPVINLSQVIFWWRET